jgi:uncharacterized protein (TIGR00375 family)
MKQVLDLHIHSRFSRACSKSLTLPNLEAACRLKGIDIISAGDFTHPVWFKELKEGLVETFSGSGLYRLREKEDSPLSFILGTELSLVYKDEVRTRRIHLVIHAPNLEAVSKLNTVLEKRFNIHSDGRPILGISAPDLLRLLLDIDSRFLIYPAHIWTPWFSVFGSKSGFDSLEECFKEETPNVYAFETGLSSDPEMNWRLSALDNLSLLSSSDAHSLENIGREATIMDLPENKSYQDIYDNIRERQGITGTLEFYPEEGMYHIDGHRDCSFSCQPAESRKLKNICPRCGKPLIIGVLNRVEELADRPPLFRPEKAVPFKKIVELDKIIAEAFGVKSRSSVRVKKEYDRLLQIFGSELHILLDADLKRLQSEGIDPWIIEGLRRMRADEVKIEPGYDGVYGRIRLFSESERRQEKLF